MTETHILLLTGRPGVGKTTVVRRVAERLAGWRLGGFFTEEMRDRRGRRTGFRAVGFSGARRVIAHVDVPGRPRVARYGVDVAAVDALATSELAAAGRDACLIDEIGKMECLAPGFVAAVRRLLDSPLLVVATVGLRGGGLIAEVKSRRDAELWQVTPENRSRLADEIVGWLTQRRSPTGSIDFSWHECF